MTDSLQLGIFVAILIAFVFVGCLATRTPNKSPYRQPSGRCSRSATSRRTLRSTETAYSSLTTLPSARISGNRKRDFQILACRD